MTWLHVEVSGHALGVVLLSLDGFW